MNLETFEQLRSELGTRALAAAVQLQPTESTLLAALTQLRKQFPAHLAQAALDTVLLRKKATRKFALFEQMFFTAESLEVASGEIVSQYRAARFAKFGSVADLCCGIGGDTIQLAKAVPQVVALETDPLRLAMAQANIAAHGLTNRVRFLQQDVLAGPLPEVAAAFADPARRADGARFRTMNEYLPPPKAVAARFPEDFPLAFKLAPGVAHADLNEWPEAEAEFLFAEGEMKECVLWLGPLRTTFRRATLLPEGHTLFSDNELSVETPTEIRKFLYDPNPAVVRAELVPLLAKQLSAEPTDYTVQMLTSDSFTPTPFATAYSVEAVVKYDAKAVNAALRAANVGRVTPIHRGAPPDAAEFTKRWKLPGTDHRTVFLTRNLGSAVVVLCERGAEVC